MTQRLELDEHDTRRLAEGLDRAAAPVSLAKGVLTFHDHAHAAHVQLWVERLIRFNKSIPDDARRRGAPLSRHKPRDEVDLIVALVKTRPGMLAEVWHEVVWRQPFPNANHRTTSAGILEALGVESILERVRAATERCFIESKRLLDGSDRSLTDEVAKEWHLASAQRLVAALQSMS